MFRLQENDEYLESGFEVMIIWESDYKDNKEIILEKCKQFLTQ